jgi:hypothetical protein
MMQAEPLGRIPVGVDVFNEKTRGFTDLLIFVKGKLTEGDVEKVNGMVKQYANLFNIIYAAHVKKVGDRFELDQVSVGFSTPIKGLNVTIDSSSADQLGAGLNFIGKSVLSGNEKALEEIMVVARNKTMVVIDAPSMMQHQGKHQKMPVRFFVWVSPEHGKVGVAVWLLKKEGNRLVFAENQFNFINTPLTENRAMHVDGKEFNLLGIPSPAAFAMTAIPPGQAFPINNALRKVGAASEFNEALLIELAKALSESMNIK